MAQSLAALAAEARACRLCAAALRHHLRTAPRYSRAEESSRGIGRLAALALLCGMGVAAAAQSDGPIRLTLLQASARADAGSCTLEVTVGKTAGETILTCDRRTSPVSYLAAHRALTPAEAAGLYEMASTPAAPSSERSASTDVDRAKTIITISRGLSRVVLDVSDGADHLSEGHRQLFRVLRDMADELRGVGRH